MHRREVTVTAYQTIDGKIFINTDEEHDREKEALEHEKSIIEIRKKSTPIKDFLPENKRLKTKFLNALWRYCSLTNYYSGTHDITIYELKHYLKTHTLKDLYNIDGLGKVTVEWALPYIKDKITQ